MLQDIHPFTKVENKDYNELIEELNQMVLKDDPEDMLQYCTTFFLHKLQQERAETRHYDEHPLGNGGHGDNGGFGYTMDGGSMNTLEEEEEEEDTIDEMPSISGPPPSSRGRRTSVSAESLQPLRASQEHIKTYIPKNLEQSLHIRAAIENNFLFKNLDEEQYTDVVNAMAEKLVPMNTHVIEQGGVGDYFYIVESGQLDCFIDGNKVTSYGPGGSFGELALMYNAPRAATLIAVTDCVLYALDRVTFRSILMENTARKRRMYERFLEEVPIFKSLEVHERHKIADALEPLKFNDNEIVLREGDMGDNFYLVESGEAVCYKRLPDGTQKQVMVVRKGDYFGELALINDEPRAATVIAHGRLKCATLGRKAFTRLLGPVMDILKRNSENYYAVLLQANPA